MSYLKATKDSTSYRFSLGSASDKTSGLFPAVKTHNTGNGNFSGLLNNVPLKAGRTYYVKVKFRTRGDGSSTSSKCSSIGFITWGASWSWSIGYIHNSATAYAEIGKIVEWTYSFTVNSDVTPAGTALFFIINNGWANGNDGQTIDLYYYKYWDSKGNVYDENYRTSQYIPNLKWEDGTLCTNEKIISPKNSLRIIYPYQAGQYFLEVELKSDAESYNKFELYMGHVSYNDVSIKNTYKKIKYNVGFSKDTGNFACAITNNGDKNIYVKNLHIYYRDDFPYFLKVTKGGNIFYARISEDYPSFMKLGNGYDKRLKLSGDCYTNAELCNFTYEILHKRFSF